MAIETICKLQKAFNYIWDIKMDKDETNQKIFTNEKRTMK